MLPPRIVERELMPLVYAGPDDHGVIWIIDQKRDKTIVMLACSPQSPVSGGVVPDGESDDDEDLYPLYEEEHNAVVLDVTALEPGPQRFESGTFLTRAADYGRHHAKETLDPSSAQYWGMIDADEERGFSPHM
jgi:hypothetical protein